jgi:hypothetical protein
MGAGAPRSPRVALPVAVRQMGLRVSKIPRSLLVRPAAA